VLARLEGKLYGSREEVLDVLRCEGGRNYDLGREDEFMGVVRAMGGDVSSGGVGGKKEDKRPNSW
jgi:hypothetical protein